MRDFLTVSLSGLFGEKRPSMNALSVPPLFCAPPWYVLHATTTTTPVLFTPVHVLPCQLLSTPPFTLSLCLFALLLFPLLSSFDIALLLPPFLPLHFALLPSTPPSSYTPPPSQSVCLALSCNPLCSSSSLCPPLSFLDHPLGRCVSNLAFW